MKIISLIDDISLLLKSYHDDVNDDVNDQSNVKSIDDSLLSDNYQLEEESSLAIFRI